MLINKSINQTIIIAQMQHKMNKDIQYYSNQFASIKGIKRINSYAHIYLVEFLNYNRMWLIQKEFKFYKH